MHISKCHTGCKVAQGGPRMLQTNRTMTYRKLVAKSRPLAPRWLSQLSIWLWLRSWSNGLWVQAPNQALHWQFRTWRLLQIRCLCFSLPLPCSHSFSVKNKRLQKKKKDTGFVLNHPWNWILTFSLPMSYLGKLFNFLNVHLCFSAKQWWHYRTFK